MSAGARYQSEAFRTRSARGSLALQRARLVKDGVGSSDRIDMRTVLVDGNQLAELMIDHDVGVTRMASYETKRVDADYFEQE
ncbi:MAG: restriction endonuclease [bacterium]|nr:restriction endonuclease [bacterium]